MLREPDDAQIRQVAQGLVERAGTDAAASALTQLYGRDRAIEALCRSATAGSMGLADDIEVILDMTGIPPASVDLQDPDMPVIDLTAAPRPRPFTTSQGHHVTLRSHRRPATHARPYWL